MYMRRHIVIRLAQEDMPATAITPAIAEAAREVRLNSHQAALAAAFWSLVLAFGLLLERVKAF